RAAHPDLPSFPTRRSSDLLIFAAGRLWDRAKNIEVLAAAAPGLDWPVQVAGPADADPCQGVTWLGQLPHSALREHLQHAAIFVRDRKSTRLNSSHVAISYA